MMRVVEARASSAVSAVTLSTVPELGQPSSEFLPEQARPDVARHGADAVAARLGREALGLERSKSASESARPQHDVAEQRRRLRQVLLQRAQRDGQVVVACAGAQRDAQASSWSAKASVSRSFVPLVHELAGERGEARLLRRLAPVPAGVPRARA
jgi:hypothetical protein